MKLTSSRYSMGNHKNYVWMVIGCKATVERFNREKRIPIAGEHIDKIIFRTDK